jgi:hypothetical protein
VSALEAAIAAVIEEMADTRIGYDRRVPTPHEVAAAILADDGVRTAVKEAGVAWAIAVTDGKSDVEVALDEILGRKA